MTTGSSGTTGSPRPGALTAQYSSAQRAAVIIAVLGDEAARPIVEKLDEVSLTKVSSALEDIRLLSREAFAEIVMDFLGALRGAPGGLAGGSLQAREMIQQIVSTRRSSGSGGGRQDRTQPDDASGVWQKLEKRPAEDVAKYLSTLSPSLIALVMRKFSPSRASDILCHIDEAKLLPLMDCMVEAVADDPGIESIVARMISMEFLTETETDSKQDDQHLESVGEILSLIPASKRESLVAFLQSRHESKLSGIRKSMFTIDNLPDVLPRAAVPVAFREMEADRVLRLIASIQQTYPAVAEFLLSNVSTRLANQLREDMKALPPLAEKEAESLQKDFLSSLMTLKRSGAIGTP